MNFSLLCRLALLIVIAGFVGSCATPYVYPAGPKQVLPELYDNKAVMDDGYSLPVRKWGNDLDNHAIILAIHGLNDYSKGFESTGNYLAEHKIMLLSYDQRGFGETDGHGLWHGSQRIIQDAATIIHLLREKYPDKPLFLMGESMGGAVVLATLKSSSDNTDNTIAGTILIAPAIWSRNTMPWYQRALLWLAVHTVPDKALTGEGLDIKPSDNIEMLRALGRDPLVIKATRVDVLYGVTNLMDIAADTPSVLPQDTLILYGKHDQIVPREPTCHWLNSLPETIQANTVLYDQGYHMLNRDLQAEQVLADIASWVELATNVELAFNKGQDNAVDALTQVGLTGNTQSLKNFCKK